MADFVCVCGPIETGRYVGFGHYLVAAEARKVRAGRVTADESPKSKSCWSLERLSADSYQGWDQS